MSHRGGEQRFVEETKHLSICERALVAPSSHSPWSKSNPKYEGELFSMYSSFANGDAFRFAHPHRSGAKDMFEPLQKLESRYQNLKDLRTKYDDGASIQFARFKERSRITPTRWNGTRDFFRDEKFLCNGEPFPDEKYSRRFGSVPPLKSASSSPVLGSKHTRCLTQDILHTHQNPSEFGALRLYNTPTHSTLRHMQSRVEESRDKLFKRQKGII